MSSETQGDYFQWRMLVRAPNYVLTHLARDDDGQPSLLIECRGPEPPTEPWPPQPPPGTARTWQLVTQPDGTLQVVPSEPAPEAVQNP